MGTRQEETAHRSYLANFGVHVRALIRAIVLEYIDDVSGLESNDPREAFIRRTTNACRHGCGIISTTGYHHP